MSALKRIREEYGVPAIRLGRVRVKGKPGTITAGVENLITVRFDDGTRRRCHPTYKVEYLDGKGGAL